MTPSVRILSYAAKMVLKFSTIAFVLGILAVWPTLALSLARESPLYDYIISGVDRLEQTDRVRREVSRLKSAGEEDVKSALETAESITKHLAQYENVLHGRMLLAAEGTPSHTALMVSWSDDCALAVAKRGYIDAKASHYLNHKLCMRYGTSASYCADQLTKLFKPSPLVEGCSPSEYRTFNGSCNNEAHPSWGSAFTPYSRLLPASYRDGIWEPREREMVPKNNAAEISSGVLKQAGSSLKDVTLAVAGWAGLVSYDMAHTVSNRMFVNGDPVICCEGTHWKLAPRHRHPLCMPVVDRKETKCFNYVRSMLAQNDDYRFGPANQMNAASHLLDGSGIYGNTEEVAKSLRTGSGGQIKVPSVEGHKSLPHLFSPSSHTAINSGEIRLNNDVVGAALRSVLTKEHNRVASELASLNPTWDDEKLFQEARRIVIAELQHITYKEWLPLVIGEKDVTKRGIHVPKTGYADVYNKNIRPSVSNSFANAAMRFIVSLLDEQINLYDEGRTPEGNMTLRYNLIEPGLLDDEKTLSSLVRSLVTQNCQANDLSLPQAVTKYLYSTDNETGFDALSLDIQRGRDHGLPPYVAFRKMFGLRHQNFDDLMTNIPKEIVDSFKKAYENVNSIDLIVGGLAEKPKKGALLGTVFSNIISQQMVATRVGDRYFYDNKNQPHPFTTEQLAEIRKVSLASLLCDNSLVKKMQPSAFHKLNDSGNKLVSCDDTDSIKRLNLNLWKEESL